jgi:hypothetical protein
MSSIPLLPTYAFIAWMGNNVSLALMGKTKFLPRKRLWVKIKQVRVKKYILTLPSLRSKKPLLSLDKADLSPNVTFRVVTVALLKISALWDFTLTLLDQPTVTNFSRYSKFQSQAVFRIDVCLHWPINSLAFLDTSNVNIYSFHIYCRFNFMQLYCPILFAFVVWNIKERRIASRREEMSSVASRIMRPYSGDERKKELRKQETGVGHIT